MSEPADRAENFFQSKQELVDLLEMADHAAKTDWEMEFVSQHRGRLEQFGLQMFMSQKQYDRLVTISEQ